MRIVTTLQTLAAAAALMFVSVVPSSAGPTYAYDELGRVVSVTYANGKQVLYSYDAAGNRTQELISATTVNRKPVANPDAMTINDNQASVSLDPRTNDTDPDGNALTLYSVSNGQYGNAALTSGSTQVTYTPTTKKSGTDKLVYVITDGHGMNASGQITVTLVNLPPVTVADSILTAKNTSLNFDPRTNDSDPGGESLTLTAASTPSHGTVSVGTGGASLTYVPSTNYLGADSFTYTVTNPEGTSATGTVSAFVSCGSHTPVAVNDNSGAMGGQTRTLDPRVNDTDADNCPFTITAKTNGSHGTVTIGTGGTSLAYAANTGFTGNDTFTYTIADDAGRSSTATVTMSDSATNRAPTAVTDSMSWGAGWCTGQAKPHPVIAIDPRWNDTDPDGQALSVTGTTNGAHGTVTRSGNVVTYTSTGTVWGVMEVTDSFTYTISDGNGGSATGTVNVDMISNMDGCGNH